MVAVVLLRKTKEAQQLSPEGRLCEK